jgi:GDP-mannose 6-dehydrogenase
VRVSVLGMGYVGAVSAACLARDGHTVIGVDLDPDKLRLIQSGRAPIVEEGIQALMSEVVASGRLTVADDAARAVTVTQVSFVCVGTPSKINGEQDQTAVLRVAEQIGAGLRETDDFHVVVIRSTVRLGTLDGQLREILERVSGKRADVDFALCFQPEFLREGTSIRDYDNPPFTVIGTRSERAAQVLRELFGHLPCEFIVTEPGTAEALKYACNAFHAVKITFANEIGRISQAVNVDSHAVMDLVRRDTRLNISPAYLRPGFAFGGSCLPKDLRALMYMAKTRDVETPMLGSLLGSNRHHVERAADLVLARGGRRVGLIGLSFKAGTDDLRESPLVTLAEILIGKGLELSVYDPHVNIAVLMGANKRYIDKHIPHVTGLLKDDPTEVVRSVDTIIVGALLEDAVSAIRTHASSDQYVLDLAGMSGADQLAAEYQGICW